MLKADLLTMLNEAKAVHSKYNKRNKLTDAFGQTLVNKLTGVLYSIASTSLNGNPRDYGAETCPHFLTENKADINTLIQSINTAPDAHFSAEAKEYLSSLQELIREKINSEAPAVRGAVQILRLLTPEVAQQASLHEAQANYAAPASNPVGFRWSKDEDDFSEEEIDEKIDIRAERALYDEWIQLRYQHFELLDIAGQYGFSVLERKISQLRLSLNTSYFKFLRQKQIYDSHFYDDEISLPRTGGECIFDKLVKNPKLTHQEKITLIDKLYESNLGYDNDYRDRILAVCKDLLFTPYIYDWYSTRSEVFFPADFSYVDKKEYDDNDHGSIRDFREQMWNCFIKAENGKYAIQCLEKLFPEDWSRSRHAFIKYWLNSCDTPSRTISAYHQIQPLLSKEYDREIKKMSKQHILRLEIEAKSKHHILEIGSAEKLAEEKFLATRHSSSHTFFKRLFTTGSKKIYDDIRHGYSHKLEKADAMLKEAEAALNERMQKKFK